MRKFHFTLDKLRSLRQARLDQQQARLTALLAEQTALIERQTALEREDLLARQRVRAAPALSINELAAVDNFRRFAAASRTRFFSEAGEIASRIERQRTLVLDARRGVEVLNRLRDERFNAWRADAGRELENAVAELVVARWKNAAGPD